MDTNLLFEVSLYLSSIVRADLVSTRRLLTEMVEIRVCEMQVNIFTSEIEPFNP